MDFNESESISRPLFGETGAVTGTPAKPAVGEIPRAFRRFSIPLTLRWAIYISALIVLVMVLLGWFLIGQQERSYRHQTDLLGEMIIDQFVRAASEPMVADDLLSLEVLVSQQEKNDLILGMQLLDLDGKPLAGAGDIPPDLRDWIEGTDPAAGNISWVSRDGSAITYIKPVNFQKTVVGYALVSIDRRPLEQGLRSLIQALVATTVGLIILGTLLAFPLAHRLCRPIHQLVRVGEAIDRGEAGDLEAHQRRDEIGQVLSSFKRMAEGLEQKRHVERTLSRYLSPSVAQKVLSLPKDARLSGSTAEGSVLFCDIVGFTNLSEQLEPEQVANLLNDYFRYFALAASSSQGTVDKFIGDCIMILFGVPDADERHALHALTCALLIQTITEEINRKRQAAGEQAVLFRIGINSGRMLAGNLGSEERMQYTVVGDAVNLASRICGKAEPGEILLTEKAALQPGMARLTRPSRMGAIKVRGRRKPVVPYEVDLEGFSDLGLIQEDMEIILGSRESGL